MSNSAFILRASICAFAILLLNAVSSVSAQSGSHTDSDFDFPYQAIVRNDDTEIFSGPASVHYTTDKVAQGEIVQVYRHDPGGWCAIRPNEGSFSLIPEAAVEIIEEGFGEITQDNTQAWVGTRLGSVDKPLWQIKLKAGEEVEILGEASWPSPDGHSTVWYQIAPPAGEFRWVRFADLRTPPTDTRPVPDARTSDLALNKTDSGFKYDESSEAKNPEAETILEKTTESGFYYVGVQQKEAAQRKTNSTAVNADRLASARSPNVRSANGRTESDWQWSNSGREEPRQATSPRLATRDRDTSKTPTADKPKRESQEGIDFKFRPIGQTASLSGRFQSAPKEKVIRDAAVAPAAYQSPVYDSNDRTNFTSNLYDNNSQSSGQFGSNESNWRRGRSELAQRKSQYEAKYDQFNDQIQVDRHDIEDSFGIRMEELPDRPRSYTRPQYGDVGRYDTRPQFGDARRYDTTPYQSLPQNNFPPADRYASLNTGADMHPHSTLTEKLTPRLTKIEEQLTNEMLKRPNEWQLADLELSVGQIYSQTSKPVERLQSQRIMDKISKCKVIRNGYTKNFQASGETFGTSVRSLSDTRGSRFALGETYQSAGGRYSGAGGVSSAGFGSSATSSRGRIIGSGVDTDFEMNARFDATGWLTELVSEDRNNRPVYVLVNDSGKITHHVAGSPGLNLHRYLKSKVGVSGRQGYNNRMKLDHITAEMIDELHR